MLQLGLKLRAAHSLAAEAVYSGFALRLLFEIGDLAAESAYLRLHKFLIHKTEFSALIRHVAYLPKDAATLIRACENARASFVTNAGGSAFAGALELFEFLWGGLALELCFPLGVGHSINLLASRVVID